jgi:hypothetical protein
MKVTPTPCDVWKLLDDAKIGHHPGMHIQCSLFGKVRAIRHNVHTDELIGEIPDWLQRDARDHGFKVIGADWRNSIYTLEILPYNK